MCAESPHILARGIDCLPRCIPGNQLVGWTTTKERLRLSLWKLMDQGLENCLST